MTPPEVTAEQARLFEAPLVGLYPVTMAEANRWLVEWGHKFGAVDRPFHQEAFALELDGKAVAVATSGSIVNGPVGGFQRDEVVELTRLAASLPWVNRIMLRLWREVCAPRWASWPVKAAVSYSHNAMHRGDLYRFDGWEKVREDAGSAGGGTWTRRREPGATVQGRKTLWLWKYRCPPR